MLKSKHSDHYDHLTRAPHKKQSLLKKKHKEKTNAIDGTCVDMVPRRGGLEILVICGQV